MYLVWTIYSVWNTNFPLFFNIIIYINYLNDVDLDLRVTIPILRLYSTHPVHMSSSVDSFKDMIFNTLVHFRYTYSYIYYHNIFSIDNLHHICRCQIVHCYSIYIKQWEWGGAGGWKGIRTIGQRADDAWIFKRWKGILSIL